jgi:hypothetical protein
MWKIIVKPVEENLHPLDEDVAGIYFPVGITKKEALNNFHNNIPIKVLEDFEITIVEAREE